MFTDRSIDNVEPPLLYKTVASVADSIGRVCSTIKHHFCVPLFNYWLGSLIYATTDLWEQLYQLKREFQIKKNANKLSFLGCRSLMGLVPGKKRPIQEWTIGHCIVSCAMDV